MMKIMISLLTAFALIACSPEEYIPELSEDVEEQLAEDKLENSNDSTINNVQNMKMNIAIGERKLTATLVENSSTAELIKLLQKGAITITMEDYANFEKVGNLPTSLPTNDEQITTAPGDIILYLGKHITIYYDVNTWNFTRLGRIDNITQDELKKILGRGNVTVTFSIK